MGNVDSKFFAVHARARAAEAEWRWHGAALGRFATAKNALVMVRLTGDYTRAAFWARFALAALRDMRRHKVAAHKAARPSPAPPILATPKRYRLADLRRVA